MNIDRILKCNEQITVSIDKTKYLNDNPRLLKRWYPPHYNTMKLLDVTDKAGYINYTFDSRGYEILNVSNWTFLNKLECVYGLFKFEQLVLDGFTVNLDDDNIFADKNRTIVLLFIETIDLYVHEEVIQTAFEIQLKARILSLFSQYSFQDIIDSSFSLKFNSDFELEIVKCNQVSELKDTVCRYIDKYRAIEDHQVIRVSPKSFRNYQILTCISLALFTCSALFIGYIESVQVATLKLGNELYSLYMNQEYLSVIEVSRGHKLNNEQKYLIARSAVECADLANDQKTMILDSIGNEANEVLIEYWINIGYGEYLEASIKGMIINDEEYVLYALRLEESRLINDNTMDGLEKEQALAEVRTDIKTFESRLSEVNTYANG